MAASTGVALGLPKRCVQLFKMKFSKICIRTSIAKHLKRRNIKLIMILMTMIFPAYCLLQPWPRGGPITDREVHPKKRLVSDKSLTSPRTLTAEDLLMDNEELKAELRAKKSVIAFLSLPIINNHNFDYIHNNVKACALNKPEVLLVVPSAPENFEKRENVRKGPTGQFVRAPENNATLLFFIGRPPCGNESSVVQARIDEEFNSYGDIVQENYEDVYKMIRLKAVGMLRWAVNHCKNAKYVIRVDDDIEVNISTIVPVVKLKGVDYADFIIGSTKLGWEPVRNTSKIYNKYAISESEYPNSTYPTFALGGLLGYPLSTVSLLYQAALRVKPIWLDDVYITGICSRHVDVPLLNHTDFTFKHGTDET